jgi:release factor glutamine methyltransferase
MQGAGAGAGTARTLRDELDWATRSLQEVGSDTPRLDAELLLARALGIDRTALMMRSGEWVTPDVRTLYLSLVARRASHEPVAYILGRKGFRHLDLAVDPRVLIPRPETELLVETAVSMVPSGARVADVGTGSGAVALALKDERPDLDVTGIELNAGALSLAQLNAARLRLDVRWVLADLLDEGFEYDAVVANLPYVADDAVLPPDVLNYEPASALFAGVDGLDVIRRLLALLALGGGRDGVRLVALEIGFDQGTAVASLVAAAGFDVVEVRQDLAGLDRVVVGQR